MPDLRRKRLVLLATGGTIAGAQSETQAGRYTAGSLNADDLIAAVPGLACLLYTSPSPRDKRQSRMPSSA